MFREGHRQGQISSDSSGQTVAAMYSDQMFFKKTLCNGGMKIGVGVVSRLWKCKVTYKPGDKR